MTSLLLVLLLHVTHLCLFKKNWKERSLSHCFLTYHLLLLSLTHSLTHSLFHSFRLPIALSIADLFHYIRALSRTALYLSGHGFYIVLVVPRSCDGRYCLLPVFRMSTRLGLHEVCFAFEVHTKCAKFVCQASRVDLTRDCTVAQASTFSMAIAQVWPHRLHNTLKIGRDPRILTHLYSTQPHASTCLYIMPA